MASTSKGTRRAVWAAAVVSLAAGAAHAATPAAPRVLRRADVIEMAARHNPQVAAARAQEAAAEAVEGQADAARWPMVTVQLGIAPSVKATHAPGTVVGSVESSSSYSLDDLTATLAGSVTVLQPLFTFGKIDERREAARHNARARAAQVAMTRADVALEAARMYELCAFARALQRFFEEVEFTLQRNLADTRARVEAGAPDLSDQDVARLEVALRAARIAHHQASAGVERALAGLRAWLGLPPDAAITVPDDAFGPISTEPSALEDLVELALERRADLEAARQGRAAYEALGRAEAAGWWPDFVLLGGIDAAWTPGRDWLDTRFVVDPLYHVVPFVALGARWQIWGPMASRRRDEMLAQARRYGHLFEWARVGVPAQVADAWHRVKQARADLTEARGGLHRARQWMVGAAADFAMGLAVSRDVTDAVQGYVTMRLAYADAVRRLNTALAELGHATGTLLDAHSPYAAGVRPGGSEQEEEGP